MQREPRLIDDLSEDGDLAMLAGLSVEAVAVLMNDIAAMPMAEANAYCRDFALQILEELGGHLTDWDERFCLSVTEWVDRRRLTFKQMVTLHRICREAAARALVAERRSHMASALPANTLPL
jgi:hypothetical protein